ncbi:MAG: hypothetical protein JWN89_699 [Parcubacteria group bacterium]|nr:hypothetical protein [Parcubacteria group bacterium]
MRLAFSLGAKDERQALIVLGVLSVVLVILSIIVLRIGLTPSGTGPLPPAEVQRILEKTAHPPEAN